jgi:hypothetical protein
MPKRFVIVGRTLGGTEEQEICEVDSNPEPIMTALRRLPAGVGPRGKRIRKYDWVRALDREQLDAATAPSSCSR